MINTFKRLKIHARFLSIFTNISWLMVEKVLRMFVGLFVGIWMARYLGPEQFGLYHYVLAFISMFGFFVTLGMDSGIVVKELKSTENDKKILATTLFMKGLGAIIAISLIAIVIRFVENDSLTVTLVTVAGLTYLFKIFSVFDLYFQSMVKSKYIVISNLIALVTVAIIKVVLILINAELIYFIYAVILEVCIASMFYVYFYIKNIGGFNGWFIDLRYVKVILLKSWPIMISAFLISVYMQIDVIMIKNMLGNNEAGLYAAAIKITTLFYVIPIVITSSVYPAILKAKKIDEKLYYKRFEKLFDFSVLFMLPTALLITFFADFIIDAIYTDTFSMAASVLAIHIWAAVFVFFNNIQMKWYITEDLQKLALIRIAIATALNIVLNIFLIPLYGINGAAFSTLIAFAFSGYLGNFFLSNKTRQIFIIQTKALLVIPQLIKFKREFNL